MVKFIIISFVFHISLIFLFEFNVIDLNKNKQQTINVGILETQDKPINQIKPKKEKKDKISNKPKPKPKPPKPKAPKPVSEKNKKAITKQENKLSNNKRFDDLLKNLAEEKLPENKHNKIEQTIEELSQKKLTNEKNEKVKKIELSKIEKLIMQQIDENWSRPPGIKVSENLVIKMIVYLDINGNVINLEVHKKTQKEISNNKNLLPYLNSSIRAIKKASPFEGLKKDRYNVWKEIIINFKPIETR